MAASNKPQKPDPQNGNYQRYRDTDEGDSSVRAGAYDAGRREPVQPDSNEQSGSTGRPAGDVGIGRGKDTGQGRYGQTGVGGSTPHPETDGQANYRKSGARGDPDNKERSNPGSGTAEHEAEEYQGDDASKRLRQDVKP